MSSSFSARSSISSFVFPSRPAFSLSFSFSFSGISVALEWVSASVISIIFPWHQIFRADQFLEVFLYLRCLHRSLPGLLLLFLHLLSLSLPVSSQDPLHQVYGQREHECVIFLSRYRAESLNQDQELGHNLTILQSYNRQNSLFYWLLIPDIPLHSVMRSDHY